MTLPLYAKIAIERLDADHSLRDNVTLDFLVVAYAKTYGTQADDETRNSCLDICRKKFGATFTNW